MGVAKHTPEYKQKFVTEVLALNKQGSSLANAAKKLGHTPITFRNWRKALSKKTTTPAVVFHKTPRKYTKKMITTNTTPTGRVAVFYCTPTQAAEIIRGL